MLLSRQRCLLQNEAPKLANRPPNSGKTEQSSEKQCLHIPSAIRDEEYFDAIIGDKINHLIGLEENLAVNQDANALEPSWNGTPVWEFSEGFANTEDAGDNMMRRLDGVVCLDVVGDVF